MAGTARTATGSPMGSGDGSVIAVTTRRESARVDTLCQWSEATSWPTIQDALIDAYLHAVDVARTRYAEQAGVCDL